MAVGGHTHDAMEPITSTRNPLVVDVIGLHRANQRKRRNRTLLEGPVLLAEALAAGIRPELVLTVDPDRWSTAGERVVAVSETVLSRVGTTVTPQDPIAVIVPPAPHPPVAPLRMLLWDVADPGNLGTLIRSATAFGADIALGGTTADPWSPKVLRSSAGTALRARIGRVSNPAEAAEGTVSAALVVDGGVPLDTLDPGPHTLVVGSEAHGLPSDVAAACDLRVTIPMPGRVESLNAAVAGSIALHHVATRLAATPDGEAE